MFIKALIISFVSIQTLSIDCATLPTRTVQFDFYSDLDDWINGNLYPNGAFAATTGNSLIRDSVTNGLWLWESPMPYDYSQTLTIYVSKSFYIPGTPTWAQMIIKSDNSCTVKLNNVVTSCTNSNSQVATTCDLTSNIIAGNNALNITVVNTVGTGDYTAGVTYKLSVKTTVKAIEEAAQ